MRVPGPLLPRLEALAWAVLLLLFAGFAAYLISIVIRPFAARQFLFNDFFAQWSFARFAWDGLADDIYDQALLHQYQVRLAPALRDDFPYPYPPTFLLYILPLGGLPYIVAYGVWIAVTFALYLAAAWPRQEGWLARGVVLLAPAVACNMGFGQNGFLTAALLIGGFRLLPARPVLAGIAFGLLSFKPQFGVLVPIALLAAGEWRCIGAALATLLALGFASIMVFDWSLWPDWLAYLPQHTNHVDTRIIAAAKPTMQNTLVLAGVGLHAARSVSILLMGAAAGVIWRAFRERDPTAPALLVAATFAAAPYALLYDLPALVAPALAALARRPPGPARLADDAVIALGLATPALVSLDHRLAWLGGPACLLLFVLLALRSRQYPLSAA